MVQLIVFEAEFYVFIQDIYSKMLSLEQSHVLAAKTFLYIGFVLENGYERNKRKCR